ncbi:hypothetical protein TSMEX_000283 [Taenia solium]|eukprot:TsM_000684700 transcript=TsM_000684700 gene=TsM_000684700
MSVWLTLLILPCVLAQETKPSHLESSIYEAQVVWGGIGGLFRNRFNESSRNLCINNGNAENLSSQFDGNLKRILEAMKNVSDAVEQKPIVSDTDRKAVIMRHGIEALDNEMS